MRLDDLDPADESLRATEVFMITDDGQPLLEDTGRPIFFGVEDHARAFAAVAVAVGIEAASYRPLRLAPDVGDVLLSLGLDEGGFVLVEATTLSAADLGRWMSELARRAAARKQQA